MKQCEKIVLDVEGVVLEVGCGFGMNFDFYDQDKVKYLYVIELVEGMVKCVKQVWIEGVYEMLCDIYMCGVEVVLFDDNSVDMVVVIFVLCIIFDWESFLIEL